MKMWSGRFRQPLDPEFERWQRSLPFDQRLVEEEAAASGAHARALERLGILSVAELASILQGLEAIRSAAQRPEYFRDDEAEDIHHFVEKRLVELIGETGYKLHSGRSRNEQIATDLRLYIRKTIDELEALLLELLDVLVARAEKSGAAAMPAYTHLQAAEPVLVAHWLLAYAEMFVRDFSRLADCRKRLNVCPLGSGAIAGAPLELERAAIAKELGFTAPTGNSVDATSDRDFAIEFAQVVSLLFMHLSRWAEEMIVFSSEQYGFVRLPESYSTGSSAMPQKKNPDAMELIRGKAARMIGNAVSLIVTLKGLPLAYNKDLQETQEPVFIAAETAIQSLRTTIGFVRQVEFNFERMQSAAQAGFMNALAAATYLVNKGTSFRKAHEQIGNAVCYCLEKGCELADLSMEELRRFSPEFTEDFYSCLQLDAVLACHNVAGGTHPSRVREALAEMRRQISVLSGDVHAHA
jgi:argininosuccinate lyase